MNEINLRLLSPLLQVLVVDVDHNKILQSCGDEASILPRKLQKSLQSAMMLILELTDKSDGAQNVLISEFFIRMFVELCGHYSHHIYMGPDGKKHFRVCTFKHDFFFYFR